eukprot:gene17043-19498_t
MSIQVFLLLLLIQLFIQSSSLNIAVCISGQTSRWVPEYLYDGLIASNPNHYFYLFFNLQYQTSSDISSTFTTKTSNLYQLTPINQMKHSDMMQYVHKLFTTENSQIAAIELVPPKSLQEWKKSLKHNQLDRIYLYTRKQHAVMNLYSHQHRCLEQMKVFQDMHSVSFDYVLNTREDIYYFSPIVLDRFFLTSMKNDSTVSGKEVAVPTQVVKNSLADDSCGIMAKDCLKWNGTNMRWQLLPARQAVQILGNRFRYYEHLYSTQATLRNPEIFELNQYKHFGINICEFSVSDLPVAAIRYFGSPKAHPSSIREESAKTCFIPQEYGDNCVPEQYFSFVRKKNCNQILKRN